MDELKFTLLKNNSDLAILMETYLTALNTPFDIVPIETQGDLHATIIVGEYHPDTFKFTAAPNKNKYNGKLGFKIFKRFYPLPK